MIFVVLGMHKSGTTLVSEILHKSGVNMVESYDPTTSYPRNRVERQSTLKLNYKLLNSEDVFSLDVIKNVDSLRLTPELSKQMKEVISECENNHKDWGFKDPRTCLTYNLWKENLPAHRIIMVYRHPKQVVNYYIRRTNNIFKKWSRTYHAIKNWKAYNQLLLNFLKENDYPLILINYQDLLDGDKVLAALSKFIGTPAHDARLKKPSSKTSTSLFALHFFDLFSKGKALQVYQNLENKKFK